MQNITNKECPQCGKDMTKGKFKWICEYCEYKQDFQNNDMNNLYEDMSDLFFEPAIISYYPLLAHEYNVLKNFYVNNNYFAALLQYKDVVEILLKFPVLLAINKLWHKDEQAYTTSDKNNIKYLLEKLSSLSLGDWQRLCGNFKNQDDPLGLLLNEIYAFYQDNKIVNWRNNTIGHGALQSDLDSDEDFKKDFNHKLKTLKKHLEDNLNKYLMIKVCSVDGNQLRGWECEGVLDENINIYIGEEYFGNPSPFILVKVIEKANDKKKLTDLFDSYSYAKNEVYVLNYVKYGKATHVGNIADEFALRSRQYLNDEQLTQSSVSLNDTLLYQDDIESLRNMADDAIFEPPNYILKRIKTFINDHPQGGVMFLQMERGMGKTTLVRALDQLAMYKERIDSEKENTIVRAFYINNKFAYNIEDFSNEVLFLLSVDHRGSKKPFRLGVSPNFADKCIKEMAGIFAQFLIRVREEYQKPPFEYQKLLFIIDGLDEMQFEANSESGTIFDCIPCSEQMGEGVYVLVTGRSEDEINIPIREQYNILKTENIEFLRYSRVDEGNNELLKNYLAKQLNNDKKYVSIPKANKYIVDTLCRKGDYRFLYVKALRELVRVEDFNIETITNRNIMQCYLELLKREYGNGKYFENIKYLLLIASILEEPATIEELAYLYNCSEPVNLRFLGYLTDLRGFLKIERTEMSERISVHEGWKQGLNEYENNSIALNDIIIKLLKDFINRVNNEKHDTEYLNGESYIVANLYFIIKEKYSNLKSEFYRKNILNYMMNLSLNVYKGGTIEKIKRVEQIYTTIISILDDANREGVIIIEVDDLISIYMERASTRNKLLNFDGAISDYSEVINISNILINNNQLKNNDKLLKAYSKRGMAYRDINNHIKAQDDFNSYINLFESTQKNDNEYNDIELSGIYMNRGIVYHQMGESEKAIIDYTECIKLKNRMINMKSSKIMTREVLFHFANSPFMKLMKRLSDDNKNEPATIIKEEDDNEAINFTEGYKVSSIDKNTYDIINKSLPDVIKSIIEVDLAMVYMNRGTIYYDNKNSTTAIADYKKCIEIFERLCEAGFGMSWIEKDLATVYNNSIILYKAENDYVKAINSCTKCIEILSKLLKYGKLLDENELAIAYLNRAFTYDEMDNHIEAINDYDTCINIMNDLYASDNIRIESYLSSAYYSRGVCFTQNGKYDNAINDLNLCIEIRDKMLNDKRLLNEEDLANSYMARGYLLHMMKNTNQAIEDLNCSLSIWEGLKFKEKEFDKSNWDTVINLKEQFYNELNQ